MDNFNHGTIMEPLVTTEFIRATNRIVPRLDFRLLADRDEGYYIWKVIVPLCLIVLMAWAVFWINPEAIGFVFFSTILVFIALGIAVLSSRIASAGNLHRALKIEKVSRIVYLLVLVAIIFFTLWL